MHRLHADQLVRFLLDRDNRHPQTGYFMCGGQTFPGYDNYTTVHEQHDPFEQVLI